MTMADDHPPNGSEPLAACPEHNALDEQDAAHTLRGKVAWITGGSSGIGRATAQLLTRRGARVGVLDLASPEQDLPWAQCDLGSSASVEEAARELTDQVGAADVLVCSGGINRGHVIADHPDDLWDRVLAVNLSGAFYSIRACLPQMLERGWGRIVTLSSGSAVRVMPSRAAYASSKAGLIALTKAAAVEGAARGVTANVIAPGLTDTRMVSEIYGDRAAEAVANPMGVLLDPMDIAQGVAFLCSNTGRHITGQLLHINAGGIM